MQLTRRPGTIVLLVASATLVASVVGLVGIRSSPSSPRGDLILFAVGPPRGLTNALYVIRPDGNGLTRLTRGFEYVADPVWSPDGELIAFSGRRGDGDPDRADIFVMGADGGDLRQLSDGDLGDFQPTWSPDGKQIAFVRRPVRPGGYHAEELDVMLMNADGSGVRRLTRRDGAQKGSLAWAPDGHTLAYVGSRIGWGNIYLADPDTGVIRPLTAAGGFTWAPDGRSLALSSPRERIGISLIRRDGGTPRYLFRMPLNVWAGSPAWAPNARAIAFVRRATGCVQKSRSTRRGPQCSSTDSLQLVRLNGARVTVTKASKRFMDFNPSWSPDGSQIAFTRYDDTDPSPIEIRLAVVRADGSGLRVFPTGDLGWSSGPPQWRP